MKKILLTIFIIFLFQNCSSDTDPIDLPETVKLRETVVVEVTKVVEKEKIIYIDFTKMPIPWTTTPTPTIAPAWTPTPTPTPTPVTWEFYLSGILVTPTPSPPSTWTPTPTPKPMPTWTPTPTPTPLPPGDLGYEKTSITTSANLTDIGQIITIGIPMNKSPIVDHDQDNDLTDGITTNDDNQFKILSVNHIKNSNSEITIISLVPTGESVIKVVFWTTRK